MHKILRLRMLMIMHQTEALKARTAELRAELQKTGV